MALSFPDISPIALSLGPLHIRWYALAYIAGIVIGWWWARRQLAHPPQVTDSKRFDDLVMWLVLGVVLGGRLGYVLFYKPLYFLSNPEDIFALWQGGMSFHGGFLGVVLAVYVWARRTGTPLMHLADLIAWVAPIGLFFGRLANFVNGELWGRVSTVPWAMIFPTGGPDPRHPSQLYQAGLEGICIFLALTLAAHRGARRTAGLMTGIFVIGYGIARITGEIFRQPDAHLGFIVGPVTMGQLLSLPMLAVGIWVIWRARRGGFAPRT